MEKVTSMGKKITHGKKINREKKKTIELFDSSFPILVTNLGFGDARQLRQVVTQLHVLEVEGVVAVVLEGTHDLVTHPLNLAPPTHMPSFPHASW